MVGGARPGGGAVDVGKVGFPFPFSRCPWSFLQLESTAGASAAPKLCGVGAIPVAAVLSSLFPAPGQSVISKLCCFVKSSALNQLKSPL